MHSNSLSKTAKLEMSENNFSLFRLGIHLAYDAGQNGHHRESTLSLLEGWFEYLQDPRSNDQIVFSYPGSFDSLSAKVEGMHR